MTDQRPVITYNQALDTANRILEAMNDSIIQGQVVGSLRRQEHTMGLSRGFVRKLVHDIDIALLVPPTTNKNGRLLKNRATTAHKFIKAHVDKDHVHVFKPRHIRFDYGKIPVDLFVTMHPESWGWTIVRGTGDETFARWLSLTRAWGGNLAPGLTLTMDHLYKGRQVVPTPTEDAFFEAVGLEFIPITLRTQNRTNTWTARRLPVKALANA